MPHDIDDDQDNQDDDVILLKHGSFIFDAENKQEQETAFEGFGGGIIILESVINLFSSFVCLLTTIILYLKQLKQLQLSINVFQKIYLL